MKSFILMLSFFTRLPVPYVEYEEKLYIKGIKTIPFVGIVLGLILYVVSFVNLWFDPEVTAVVLLMTYIFMTGGLHLDGLADTCDGVFSGRERERMLEIMKELGMEPILDLEMRLGEGTGCPLAFHIIGSACYMMSHMYTFEQFKHDQTYRIDLRK